MTTPLVSCQWLNENSNDADLVVLDVSPQPSARQIKGARYVDVKNVFSDPTSDLPNTFPSAIQFQGDCQVLGINSTSKIVVYDNKGVFLSPRVWWMFRTFGHQNVSVLDGGLIEWVAQGYETEQRTEHHVEHGNFKGQLQPNQVKGYEFVKSNLADQNALLIDARSAGRFNGTAPEPREGLRSGNIPGSINLPYTEVLQDGKFKPLPELKTIFKTLANDNRPFVFTCGSGVTACIILLASELVMQHENAVYDGSWTEWATKEGAYYHTAESVDEYIKLAADVNGQELIDQLKNVLPAQAALLEIGSGPGSDWEILKQDFNVVGSDNSKEFTDRLKANYPDGEFLELDATTLATDKQFDGIYSNKVLQHLRDDQLATSIQRQAEILTDGGIVCHSVWKGEGSEIFKGMFVNYYTKEALQAFFATAFNVLVLEEYGEFEDNDSLLIIAKKK